MIAPLLLVSNIAIATAAAYKSLMARSLAAAGEPDPMCKTGVVSLDGATCCAGYCGECGDYPTCGSVRGQDSEAACCKTKVAEMECGKGEPANVCLKPCSEAVPPCIMDYEVPPAADKTAPHAADDCDKAVTDWRTQAENAIEAGKTPL